MKRFLTLGRILELIFYWFPFYQKDKIDKQKRINYCETLPDGNYTVIGPFFDQQSFRISKQNNGHYRFRPPKSFPFLEKLNQRGFKFRRHNGTYKELPIASDEEIGIEPQLV